MRESRLSLRDQDSNRRRPFSSLRRSRQSAALDGGSEVNETRTKSILSTRVDPVVQASLEAIPRIVERPAPVKEYDQPHPWRYVRWRKANDRQALPASEVKAGHPKGNCVYKVVPGENLAEVATKFDTYTEVLAEANKILNPYNVAVGQLLWIPKTHLIIKGNTLWSLSRRFGVSIPAIQKANGIENPNLIFADDILVVPEEWD